MKIRSVGAEFSHTDGLTDRHDEGNSRFPQLCKCDKNGWEWRGEV